MKGLPPPLPPRQRAISQPDAEVPESVYGALLGLERGITTLGQTMAANKADTDLQIAEVKALATKASAQSVERWTNLAKALVPLAITIIGGTYGVQRLAPGKEPAPVQAPRGLHDILLDECRPLAPGSAERFECFKRVDERTELAPKR